VVLGGLPTTIPKLPFFDFSAVPAKSAWLDAPEGRFLDFFDVTARRKRLYFYTFLQIDGFFFGLDGVGAATSGSHLSIFDPRR
jgi:hypothetical protein